MAITDVILMPIPPKLLSLCQKNSQSTVGWRKYSQPSAINVTNQQLSQRGVAGLWPAGIFGSVAHSSRRLASQWRNVFRRPAYLAG